MSIQVTIKDGHFITLDELVSIVPLSVAAKELKELRSRIKDLRSQDIGTKAQATNKQSVPLENVICPDCKCDRVQYRCSNCGFEWCD